MALAMGHRPRSSNIPTDNDAMSQELTKTEYQVLRVLWKQQPLSVREVHDRLNNNWAYTTTKTLMDRMAAKGLLTRESYHGVLVYQPTLSRPEGLVKLVRFFAEKVLEVEHDEVVSMFTDSRTYSSEEVEQLRKLLKKDIRQEAGTKNKDREE